MLVLEIELAVHIHHHDKDHEEEGIADLHQPFFLFIHSADCTSLLLRSSSITFVLSNQSWIRKTRAARSTAA